MFSPLTHRLSPSSFAQAWEAGDTQRVRSLITELRDYATKLEGVAEVANAKIARATKPLRETPQAPPCYVITSGAQLWKWNMGWRQHTKDHKPFGPILGHAEFKRKPRVLPSEPHFAYARPEGAWRRCVDVPMLHPLYGTGKVLQTDGVHAIFEVTRPTSDTDPAPISKRYEVTFSTLTEAAVPLARRTSPVAPVNKTRAPKELPMNLLDLMS